MNKFKDLTTWSFKKKDGHKVPPLDLIATARIQSERDSLAKAFAKVDDLVSFTPGEDSFSLRRFTEGSAHADITKVLATERKRSKNRAGKGGEDDKTRAIKSQRELDLNQMKQEFEEERHKVNKITEMGIKSLDHRMKMFNMLFSDSLVPREDEKHLIRRELILDKNLHSYLVHTKNLNPNASKQINPVSTSIVPEMTKPRGFPKHFTFQKEENLTKEKILDQMKNLSKTTVENKGQDDLFRMIKLADYSQLQIFLHYNKDNHELINSQDHVKSQHFQFLPSQP